VAASRRELTSECEVTTPDPATRTRISATHSSSWRGLRIGIICLRSGVICPILGARGKRSLFKSPSSHHAQRDRSRNWSIKTAICVVSLRFFSCRRARAMSLMKNSSRVCHRGDWMGTCARRGCNRAKDIAPKKSLRHDYVIKRLALYCTDRVPETQSHNLRRWSGWVREPRLVVSPRPISRRIPFALLVLSGYQP